jgi:succinate dehydrogenase / fumarate reductase iron-sulfur subunit
MKGDSMGSAFVQRRAQAGRVQRPRFLDDVYRLYHCRTIMNCTEVCPKQLSRSRAIERIRARLLGESF